MKSISETNGDAKKAGKASLRDYAYLYTCIYMYMDVCVYIYIDVYIYIFYFAYYFCIAFG